jgi:plasmid maintenance system antidote protein VapI
VRLAGQSNLIPAPVLAAHIAILAESGLSQCAIARASKVSQATISNIANGRLQSCLRSKGERILAVRPGIQDDISERPALGSARRLQALYAIGHGAIAISSAFDINHATVSQIVNGRYKLVNGSLAVRVESIYDQLSRIPGTSKHARTRAVTGGWAPPAAWDDERMDDPAAIPDWTGFCGTDRGYWTHRLQKLPMCQPCADAQKQWMDERADLDAIERNRQRFAARAAAGTRGIDIAHDGRELMRLGCDYEQAAARLGITRQHLQQELQRHPAPAAEAA